MFRIVPTLALALALIPLPAALARAFEGLPAVPAGIAVPGGHVLSLKLSASGVQVYRCQSSPADASGFAWKFLAPEAGLFDSNGHAAGHHFAGPSWQASDGSRITGTVVAKAPAPDGTAIPWLLLSAAVAAPGKTFGQVAFVQRLHTVGGAAPETGCAAAAANTEVRVPYTADYYFYSRK